jgi:hypothetical protein
MAARRRNRRLPWWPLVFAAAAAAAVAAYLFARRETSLPVPGRAPATSTPPREDITNGDRRRLEDILDQRAR